MKSTSLQFRDKDVVWDGGKCFAQVQVDAVSHLNIYLAFIGLYKALKVTF